MNPQEQEQEQEQEFEDISEEHLDDLGVLVFSEFEIEEFIQFYKYCFVTTIVGIGIGIGVKYGVVLVRQCA
jgi:hypothetical protein